jgi:hypothetical protein
MSRGGGCLAPVLTGQARRGGRTTARRGRTTAEYYEEAAPRLRPGDAYRIGPGAGRPDQEKWG